MASRFTEIQTEIGQLVQLGLDLFDDLTQENLFVEPKTLAIKFRTEYQTWYSESLLVVKQLIPDRFEDFKTFYSSGTRKNIVYESFSISDYLRGVSLPRREGANRALAAVTLRMQQQISILRSTLTRLKSRLVNIEQLVLSDLLDSELDEARVLNKNGFSRAAGAVAGVALEKHLKQICQNHEIKVKKKRPTISDLNDLLKNDDILDTPSWRFNQRLGDLRNLSDHDGERDPTASEINELIDGVDKVTKTLF